MSPVLAHSGHECCSRPDAYSGCMLSFRYLENVVQTWGRQWRQHTKASVSAERSKWGSPASLKRWDIAIADHADPGRAAQSMLSPCGSPMPCGSLLVRKMLPCFKKQKSVNGNTARSAAVIL